MYLRLYYSQDRALKDENAFNNRMTFGQEKLASGLRHLDHEKHSSRYFTVKNTPKQGMMVVANEENIAKAKRKNGYFALLSLHQIECHAASLVRIVREFRLNGSSRNQRSNDF